MSGIILLPIRVVCLAWAIAGLVIPQLNACHVETNSIYPIPPVYYAPVSSIIAQVVSIQQYV